MKTDDDMFINLAKLNTVVRENRKPTLLMGSLICNAVPIKVIKNNGDKTTSIKHWHNDIHRKTALLISGIRYYAFQIVHNCLRNYHAKF